MKENYVVFLNFNMKVLEELTEYVLKEKEFTPTSSESVSKANHKNGEFEISKDGVVDMSDFDYSKLKPNLLLKNNSKEFFIVSNARKPKRIGKKILKTIGSPNHHARIGGELLTTKEVGKAAALSKINIIISPIFMISCRERGLDEMILRIGNCITSNGVSKINIDLMLPRTKEEIRKEIEDRG